MNKKLVDSLSFFIAIVAAIVFIVDYEILDFNKRTFLHSSLLIFLNLFIVPIIIMGINNIIITIFRILFCIKYGLRVRTIDLSILLINIHPFRITSTINLTFISCNNLTTFCLSRYKQEDLQQIYDKYYISFTRIVRDTLVLIICCAPLFFLFNMYHISLIIISVCIQKIAYFSNDSDKLVVNPIISNSKVGYEINLFRFLLSYCKLDFSTDKTYIYSVLNNFDFIHMKEYISFYLELLTEQIFDSIIDGICYVNNNDYKLYLAIKSIPFFNGEFLNTIDVLRYFAIYNTVRDNKEATLEIIEDIEFQLQEQKYNVLFKLIEKQYGRYLDELENECVDVLLDYKYDLYYRFFGFTDKRNKVSEIYNKKCNAK